MSASCGVRLGPEAIARGSGDPEEINYAVSDLIKCWPPELVGVICSRPRSAVRFSTRRPTCFSPAIWIPDPATRAHRQGSNVSAPRCYGVCARLEKVARNPAVMTASTVYAFFTRAPKVHDDASVRKALTSSRTPCISSSPRSPPGAVAPNRTSRPTPRSRRRMTGRACTSLTPDT